MFWGETAINLDGKGRLAIPTRYRPAIGECCEGEMVLTYSPYDSDSLWLYPMPEWQRVQQDVMSLSSFNPSHRMLQRRLVGAANQVSLDASGRLLIPHTLRERANIDKRAVLMGMGQKFEVWNEQALLAAFDQHLQQGDGTAPSPEIEQLRL